MPAARYWRVVGIRAYGGGELDLSELQLYSATERVDQSATLSCSHAPASGSLSALAGAMTREAGHATPERLILESNSGHILTMNVPAAFGTLVLTVVTDQSLVLGKLLWSCSTAADQITAACAPPA